MVEHEVGAAGTSQQEWGCDNTGQHCEGVLEAEEEGEEDGHTVF